jgi:hypothetical protein
MKEGFARENFPNGNIAIYADKFIETLARDCSMRNIKSVSLKFAGREPLLHLSKVIYIARFARGILSKCEVTVRLSIISNSTLITKEIAKTLNGVGFSNILVSLTEWYRRIECISTTCKRQKQHFRDTEGQRELTRC